MPQSRVLFIAVNLPPGGNGGGELALEQEFSAIERELRLTKSRDFELVHARAATVDDVMRHLTEQEPLILHFAGHGAVGVRSSGPHETWRDFGDARSEDSTGIYLRDERDCPQLVKVRALATMIRSAAPSVRLVVLNACYSDSQSSELCNTVDCVISMAGAIGDRAARSFSPALYRALGNGRSVGNAFAQAVATLDGKQFPDKVLPTCRTRPPLDADRLFLTRTRACDHGERPRPIAMPASARSITIVAAGAALGLGAIAGVEYRLSVTDDLAHLPPQRAQEVLAEPIEVPPQATRDGATADGAGAHGQAAPPPADPAEPPKPQRVLRGSRPTNHVPGAPRPRRPEPDAPPPVAPVTDGSPAPAPLALAAPAPAPPIALARQAPSRVVTAAPGSGLGELDKPTVQHYLARSRDPIKYCYEKRLQRTPTLAGTVTARFHVTSAGTVSSSTASGMDDEVAACVAAVIKDIAFPRSGGDIEVKTPFRFAPSGGS